MKKTLLGLLTFVCCTFMSSCGCANRWVEVRGHYYKPRHYEQINAQYFSYGQWVEEQKILRVKCACGTKKIVVEESFYNEVKDGDSVFWHKSNHTIERKVD